MISLPQTNCQYKINSSLAFLLIAAVGFLPFGFTRQSLAQPEVATKTPAQDDKPKANQDGLEVIDAIEDIQTTKISLSVKDATITGIINAIGVATPKPKKIELRGTEGTLITLAVKDVEVGNILKAAAALCGCNLYVLSDRFLITKPHLMTKQERRYVEGVAQRRSERQYAFGQNVIRELQNLQVNAITLKEVNPKFQSMLQKMADLQAETTYLQKTKLPGDAVIALEANQGKTTVPGNAPTALEDRPKGFNLKIVLKSQQHTYSWYNIVP